MVAVMSRSIYDSSKENWAELFNHNSVMSGKGNGGRISHFSGVRPLYGAGIGGILRSLFRIIPSFLSSPVGQNLVSAGANVVNDINNGASLKDSVKSQARSTVRNLTGVGRKRRIQKGQGAPRAIGFIKGPAPAKGVKRRAPPTKVIRRAFIH